jgi:hypothetical protein
MALKSKKTSYSFLNEQTVNYSEFKGQIISSKEIHQHDFSKLNIAIIGTDQDIATHLEQLCLHANQVKVFQNSPQYILPKSDKQLHRLINHPLLIKNRRLFSQRIKSLLSIRYLESQIQDPWLRHLLTPNRAQLPKNILKSDSYYAALQRENCHLETWPLVKISQDSVQGIDGLYFYCDTIITTENGKC